jgi:hypothetical protein
VRRSLNRNRRAVHDGRVSDPRILPRFFRQQEELESQRKITAILLETGHSVDDLDAERGHLKHATPVDTEGLRGVPVVGRGVAGATPGSNPLAEVLRKEHRREHRERP